MPIASIVRQLTNCAGNAFPDERDKAPETTSKCLHASAETALHRFQPAKAPRFEAFVTASETFTTNWIAWWRTQSDSNPSPLPISLLTGKLTGNFVKSAHFLRFWMLTREQFQRLSAKFPTQQNRELFRRNREFRRRNREFKPPKPKSSPDQVFGTHNSNPVGNLIEPAWRRLARYSLCAFVGVGAVLLLMAVLTFLNPMLP